MALAILLQIVTLAIFFDKINGQSNNLINPGIGQNSLNQAYSSSSGIKAVTENLYQNENLGKNTIYNSPSQGTTIPLSLQSLGLSFPLQQTQNLQQLVSQSSTPISEQQPILYQVQPSNLQQSFSQSQTQHPYTIVESPTFVPVGIQPTSDMSSLNPYQYTNVGNINYQQQIPIGNPSVQPVPVQVSQAIPIPNSFVSSYSAAPVTSAGQRMELVSSLNGNYFVPLGTLPYSVADGPLAPIPALPYTAVLSSSTPACAKNVVTPYQSPNYGYINNPFSSFGDIIQDDVEPFFDYDNLTSLLMSLLQTPKRSSKHSQSSYSPYTPYKMNQASKSSSLKALLPVIFNLIKERREGCRCGQECDACKRKFKKDTEPQINEGYSKKRNYSLKDEMFRGIESDEETPRIAREHKKNKKKTKPVRKISVESDENDTDYDHLSEEEED